MEEEMKLRCPQCGIKQGKYRSRSNDYRCGVCGNIYKPLEENKE